MQGAAIARALIANLACTRKNGCSFLLLLLLPRTSFLPSPLNLPTTLSSRRTHYSHGALDYNSLHNLDVYVPPISIPHFVSTSLDRPFVLPNPSRASNTTALNISALLGAIQSIAHENGTDSANTLTTSTSVAAKTGTMGGAVTSVTRTGVPTGEPTKAATGAGARKEVRGWVVLVLMGAVAGVVGAGL